MNTKTLLVAAAVVIVGYGVYRYTKTRSEVVTAKGEAHQDVVETRQDARTERVQIRQDARTGRASIVSKTVRDIIGGSNPHPWEISGPNPGNTSTAKKALSMAVSSPLGLLSPSVMVGSAILRNQPQTGAKSAPAQRVKTILQVTRRASFPALGFASAASKTVRSVVGSRLRG